jgi:hypothetical protein
MLRRLPLLGALPPETPSLGPARALLGPGSIAIVDTDTGARAAGFGCELAIGFAALEVPVELTLLGYQGVPVLGAAHHAQLAARGINPVLLSIAPGVTPQLAGPEPDRVRAAAAVRLFVGLPALGACRAALSLLLAADRPLTSWPVLLRGVRSELSLELAAARPGLASCLATALIEHGFLPRG